MGEESKLQVGKDLVTYAQASRQLAEAHWGGGTGLVCQFRSRV